MKENNLGNTISKLRKEKNMTQLELANKLNVTDKAVSKWEICWLYLYYLYYLYLFII